MQVRTLGQPNGLRTWQATIRYRQGDAIRETAVRFKDVRIFTYSAVRNYVNGSYSGTVINFKARKRLITRPVRPTKIMTNPEIAAAAKEAKPYL